MRKKSGILASLLSMFLPGFGQFYNGHIWKGVFIFFWQIMSFSISFGMGGVAPEAKSFYISVSAIVWLISIIDAFVGAGKTNSGRSLKRISEIQATCTACGNIYYFGKRDQIQNFGKSMSNLGADLENTGSDVMCCGGCGPAAFIPDAKKQQVIDYNRCPKCGSRAIKKENVVHDV